MPHSKQRYLFIDLLRFVAVVFMIQGHTFDALLDSSYKESSLFTIHDFFHGFIAPMFLFASGVAFGVSTFKKWEQHTVLGKNFFRRVGRFVSLFIIGYALHLPYFSLTKTLTEATAVEIAVFYQSDALHCIALTMILLQVLILFVNDEKKIVTIVIPAAVIVIFVSPILWSFSFKEFLPIGIVSYINAENNSWFPLFPWSAYILCGVIFSYLFINAKEHRHARRLMKKTIIVCVVLIIAGIVTTAIPFSLYPPHDFWKANPAITLARLGFVGIVTSGLFFAEHSLHIKSKVARFMGRESLFIYVFHLVVLYGSPANDGLKYYFGKDQTLWFSIAVFVILFFSLAYVAILWNDLKTKRKNLAVNIQIFVAALLTFLFLTRQY